VTPSNDSSEPSEPPPAATETPLADRQSQSHEQPIAGMRVFVGLATAFVVVASLYFGSAVFIPVALAVLLAFLLAPVVDRFERLGMGNVPSVIVVTLLTFVVLTAAGYAILRQVSHLGDELPRYRSTIRERAIAVREVARGTIVDRFRSTAGQVMDEINGGHEGAPPPEQVAVVVEKPGSVLLQLPPLLEALSTAGLVVVLVIFILIERRGLRNRVLRIAGHAHIAVTTRALDEAAQRISRYLVMQTTINASFGVAIGTVLFLIGLPYALLFGFLAAMLRFIPYVGPLIGGGLPVLLSLAVIPGWQGPLLVLGVIVGAELICNMLLEPLLYGQSAGVSQVALLVAIAFWTWLWGPVGLIVATPLTVCLVVLSRYVPDLQFLAVLLGDEPPLDLHARLYQRLLAGDAEEAREIVHEFGDAHPESHAYDELLVPALVAMRADRVRAALSPADEQRVLRAAREVIDAIDLERRGKAAPEPAEPGAHRPPRIPAYPANGAPDDLGVAILRNLVDGPYAEIAPAWWADAALDGDFDPVGTPPPVACIVALSAESVGPARRIAQVLRRRLPSTRVVVIAWRGLLPPEPTADGQPTATSAVGSFLEARDRVWQATGAPMPDADEATEEDASGDDHPAATIRTSAA